jgi:hypothetical protein
VRRFTEARRQDEDYRGVLARVEDHKKGLDFAAVVREYQAFLATWGSRSPHAGEIEQRLKQAQEARDDRAWMQVESFVQQNPASYRRILEKAEEYRIDPDNSRHRREAGERIEDTLTAWDHADYEEFRKATEGKDGASVAAAASKADEYLDSPCRRRLMKEEVERWKGWFEGLKQERDYYIVVRSVKILDGSDLNPRIGTVQPIVHLTIQGRTYATPRKYQGQDLTMEEKLGPYKLKWGDGGKIEIDLESYHHVASNDHATLTLEDDRWPLLRVAGVVTVKCKNNKDNEVRFQCDETVPPPVKAYGR